jgi:hypothetical protein
MVDILKMDSIEANILTGTDEDSLRFAVALTSIKMETPGPFEGTHEDVLTRMKVEHHEQ